MTKARLFDGLAVALAVEQHRSFTQAARALGVSAAAVSQSVRALERRLGLPLFQRTSRKVALTEAGRAFCERVRPAAEQVADAHEHLNDYRQRPVGHLRLTVPRIAFVPVLQPLLARFHSEFPEISLEVSLDDAAIGLERGFDAGIRFGAAVAEDMVGIRLTPDVRWCVFGAPAYFARRGRPRSLDELVRHECLIYRFPTSRALHRWELMRGRRVTPIDVRGRLVTDDSQSLIAMAVQGMGLTYSADLVALPEVVAGRLEPVLEQHGRRTPGLYLYFPRRMQSQTKLRAFIDLAKAQLRQPSASAGTASRR
ncbi:MAG: transcriptional regulator [Panacagrimonas sp.]|jgi:DNA-binding transcriptional LysR family regulator|nr:LysR family transcriptional regulator [Panacagrimonas sp.]MCC2655009.1 transcriptional regulator [Panacagrimonas sp.]